MLQALYSFAHVGEIQSLHGLVVIKQPPPLEELVDELATLEVVAPLDDVVLEVLEDVTPVDAVEEPDELDAEPLDDVLELAVVAAALAPPAPEVPVELELQAAVMRHRPRLP